MYCLSHYNNIQYAIFHNNLSTSTQLLTCGVHHWPLLYASFPQQVMSCVVFGNRLALLHCQCFTAYFCDCNFVPN